MYPWISRTLDFWLPFCEKKCGLYMDVYGSLLERYIFERHIFKRNLIEVYKYTSTFDIMDWRSRSEYEKKTISISIPKYN